MLCSTHFKSSVFGYVSLGFKASHAHRAMPGKLLRSRQEGALSAPLFNSPACFCFLPLTPWAGPRANELVPGVISSLGPLSSGKLMERHLVGEANKGAQGALGDADASSINYMYILFIYKRRNTWCCLLADPSLSSHISGRQNAPGEVTGFGVHFSMRASGPMSP